MSKILSLLLTILFPTVLIAQTRPLVFTHVTVVDMVDAKPKTDMTVIIEGNRIRAIGKSSKIRTPKHARVIDASGKFLIPGFWDMHVHALRRELWDSFFPLFLANGVTGIRDMGADLVLLDANPLEDISNTKRINAVVFNGNFLSKVAREKMLADAESIANKK